MAGIKSLALRGIRSFGPEDNDEQRISFDKPLTLILGQNGCGKTTIIECLRYAVSGQMPPGSRNECFVHDAKINRSAEVLGQVKLKIVNAKDKLLEISRSMRVTMLQKKKSKFQTLDSFLSVVDEDGSAKDISSRCADLDLLVQEELGVSKAIINSVIFCHQEDSSWPLDEGKKVKERFDEIFDADKYSDCFDRIKKLRKEYSMNIKLLNLEVANLTEKKETLDKKKLEAVNTESKISEAELKVAELTSELGPVSEKLKAIETLQKELVAFETKKDKMKTRLEHCKSQEEELKKTIQTLFEGTTQELQENITNYAGTLKTKKKELEDSQRKIVSYNKEDDKIKNDLASNEVKFNKLMLLESQHQERIEKKNKMIVSSAQLAELPDIKDITCKEDADKTEELISARINALHQELDGLKAQADSEENKVQAIVNEARDALSRQKQKIDGKEGDIVKAKREIIKLQKEINQATESKQKLEKMEEKFKAAEEEFETFQKSLNVEECQKEIGDDEKMMEQHEREQDDISETISKLQKQTAKLKEKDMKEEHLKSKEKAFGVLKNKHRATITELLGTMLEKDFAVTINKLECEVRSEVDGMKKKRKSQQLEMTKLEAERKHVRELLNERRAELTSAEDQMYKACGTQTYESTLEKTVALVEKLQEDRNLAQSTLFIFRKYKEQLNESSSCPLCNRGFEQNSEVEELITDLTNKVMDVPSKLEKVSEELQKASAKKDDLLSLKTLNEKISKLKETDIPLLEKRLSDADTKIAELSESLEEIARNITAPEQKLASAKQIQGDMPLLDRFIKEIDAATKDFETVKSQCVDFTSDISLEDAQAKQTDLKTKITTLRARVKTSRTKLNAHNKKLQTMLNAKNKLKEDMLNLQKKVQQIVNLQETLKQHENDIVKFEAELKELKEGVAPLEEELKEKEMEKKVVVSKNRSEIEAKRFFISKIENSYEKVKAIQREIKQHEERNIQREMDKIKEVNERISEKKAQIVKDREELMRKIDNLKEELSKQELFKRDLDDNLKLRKAQSEAETCEKEIKDIEESLSGMNTDSIADKEQLIVKQTQLFRDKATTEGELKSSKDHLKYLKLDLMKSHNQNIDKKYTEKYYDLHVTQALDKDLRDYCVALEKCLMEFHREKMENINLIIRELWRKIYRGNDIDYIEIKTESLMTQDSDRRKYDYRVVQCKNGVEIDMRGRCSAGQKVLACLIIRLALAETFSSRFGILALDEPTTNLDQDNVRSLCTALGEIVQERMRQKNFMFIIITHDKEFIESLGNIDKVTHYYEVSRNEEGKSRIKKIRFV